MRSNRGWIGKSSLTDSLILKYWDIVYSSSSSLTRRQRLDAAFASIPSISSISISSVALSWAELVRVIPGPTTSGTSGTSGNVSVMSGGASAVATAPLRLTFVTEVFPVVVRDVEDRTLGLIVPSPSNMVVKVLHQFSRRSVMSSGSGYSNVAACKVDSDADTAGSQSV